MDQQNYGSEKCVRNLEAYKRDSEASLNVAKVQRIYGISSLQVIEIHKRK